MRLRWWLVPALALTAFGSPAHATGYVESPPREWYYVDYTLWYPIFAGTTCGLAGVVEDSGSTRDVVGALAAGPVVVADWTNATLDVRSVTLTCTIQSSARLGAGVLDSRSSTVDGNVGVLAAAPVVFESPVPGYLFVCTTLSIDQYSSSDPPISYDADPFYDGVQCPLASVIPVG